MYVYIYIGLLSKGFQEIPGTAIVTKFTPPCAYVYMDEKYTQFLQTQKFKPLVCSRYIKDICFIWTHREESVNSFMKELNNLNCEFKRLNCLFT